MQTTCIPYSLVNEFFSETSCNTETVYYSEYINHQILDTYLYSTTTENIFIISGTWYRLVLPSPWVFVIIHKTYKYTLTLVCIHIAM